MLAVGAALWLAAPPAGACACGIAIEASVIEESALVIEGPGSERIILSLDLTSDGGRRAAVVLPVPGVPAVEAVDRRRPARLSGPRDGARARGRLERRRRGTPPPRPST